MIWVVRNIGELAPTIPNMQEMLIGSFLLDHLTWIQSWMASLINHPVLQIPMECKQHSYFQLPDLSLSIHIYVTAPQYSTDEYITTDSPWAHSAPPNVPISINWGKPEFAYILETAKEHQTGAMAVSVCGPGGMGDDVRKAVREQQGEKTVDLYEESFSW